MTRALSAAELILDHVTARYGITLRDLRIGGNQPRYTTPRHLAAYLLTVGAGYSLAGAGRILHKHHTTIFHSKEKITRLTRSDRELAETLKTFIAELPRNLPAPSKLFLPDARTTRDSGEPMNYARLLQIEQFITSKGILPDSLLTDALFDLLSHARYTVPLPHDAPIEKRVKQSIFLLTEAARVNGIDLKITHR